MKIMKSMRPTVRLMLLTLALAGGLAACGKRGQLEAPPGSSVAPKAEAAGGTDAKSGIKPKRTPIVPPKRDLFIDRLLD